MQRNYDGEDNQLFCLVIQKWLDDNNDNSSNNNSNTIERDIYGFLYETNGKKVAKMSA